MQKRPLVALIVLSGLVLLYGWRLGVRSFWEPDEPRYAEIGREMLLSGDWTIPRLNFVKYYEKPPLTYWVVASSFALFGVGEGAARLGPMIAALLLIAGTWAIGRAFYSPSVATIGAVALALSPLPWASGRLLLTDMFLSAGVCGALAGFSLALREKEEGRSPLPAMALAGLGLAAAILAKGPIGIVLVLFGVVPLRIFGGRAAAVGVRGWGIAGALTLALAAPWFVRISLRDPAFAWFFFVHEHLLRYATPVAHREGAVYYYVVILLAGLFPASVLVPWAIGRTWPGMRPATREARGTLLLGSFGVLTVLFFTASRSKLASYILPAAPAFCLIVAKAVGRALDGLSGIATDPETVRRRGTTDAGRAKIAQDRDVSEPPGAPPHRSPAGALRTPAGLRASLAVAAVFALGIGAAVLAFARASNLPGMLAPRALGLSDLQAALGPWPFVLSGLLATLAVALGVGALSGRRATARCALAASAGAMFFFLIALAQVSERLDSYQSVREAARFVSARAGPGDLVASYGTLLQGLTFYTNRRTTVVGGRGELAYGASLEPTDEWFPPKKDLAALLEGRRAYIVVPTKLEEEALTLSKGRLRRILGGPRFSVLSNAF